MNENCLYLVATPIGNLHDISERALETLKNVDFIAAEDTRQTLKLLNHFDIKKTMISYYEHNKREKGTVIAERIQNGESCALVSDAGTPAISDPGEDLVKICNEKGIRVIPVPGPCAFIQALIVSGLPTGRFSFEGFLSVNKPSRKKHLEEIKEFSHTLIFYEAPHKLKTTLKDLYEAFGNREIALVKEITKIHETVIHTTLEESLTIFNENQPKGEFVIVVSGYQKKDTEKEITPEMITDKAYELINSGIDKKTATKMTAQFFGIQKRIVYDCLLEK